MTQVSETTRDIAREFPTVLFPTLTDKQRIAADLLGRCVDRREVMRVIGTRRSTTITEWLAIPEFQDARMAANATYIAELREQKSRIIAASLDLIEQELANAKSRKRVDIAHSVAKTVL